MCARSFIERVTIDIYHPHLVKADIVTIGAKQVNAGPMFPDLRSANHGEAMFVSPGSVIVYLHPSLMIVHPVVDNIQNTILRYRITAIIHLLLQIGIAIDQIPGIISSQTVIVPEIRCSVLIPVLERNVQ